VNVVSMHAPRLVGDLMAPEPVVIRADAGLGDAAKLLERHHISGLPVVDGAGMLVGVISQTDLLRARATEYLWANWQGLLVKHLMTSPALTIHRDQPLTVAARKMERHHIHRLVVVADSDESPPIGVISTSDLVRAMSGLPGDEPPALPPEPSESIDPVEPVMGGPVTEPGPEGGDGE
jgi:CBS domain-containing protein